MLNKFEIRNIEVLATTKVCNTSAELLEPPHVATTQQP